MIIKIHITYNLGKKHNYNISTKDVIEFKYPFNKGIILNELGQTESYNEDLVKDTLIEMLCLNINECVFYIRETIDFSIKNSKITFVIDHIDLYFENEDNYKIWKRKYIANNI